MQIGVISLGCVKNRVDTEQMLYVLQQEGHTFTQDPSQADIVIVNTCGFIDPAKQESIDTILEMAAYKKTGRLKKLLVTGCLAQRYGDALLQEMPEIDGLLGVSQYASTAEALRHMLQGERVDLRQRSDRFLECGRVLTTPAWSAYVRIGEGCSNCCAYCAIPLIRGRYRSRAEEDILREARGLVRGGTRELILISQDTTRYGSDTGSSLQALVRRTAEIEGLQWLRVLYLYPDETEMALLDEMEAHPNVCRYLDLPLQHASPSLLKRMNRRGDEKSTRALLRAARERGFALRTTFIVGFPGETEQDFEYLMDFVREQQFDRMGAFRFSAEEDTPAAQMPDQVPEEVAQERLDRLMALQADISLQRNRARVGNTVKTLVCGRRGARYVGRSEWESPDADGEILFTGPAGLREGTFVPVRLTGAEAYDLFGEAVPEGEQP